MRVKKHNFFTRDYLDRSFKLDASDDSSDDSSQKQPQKGVFSQLAKDQGHALVIPLMSNRPRPQKKKKLSMRLSLKSSPLGLGSSALEDEYKIIRKVGSGSFGSVYMVQNKLTGGIFAVKILEIQSKPFSAFSVWMGWRAFWAFFRLFVTSPQEFHSKYLRLFCFSGQEFAPPAKPDTPSFRPFQSLLHL